MVEGLEFMYSNLLDSEQEGPFMILFPWVQSPLLATGQ